MYANSSVLLATLRKTHCENVVLSKLKYIFKIPSLTSGNQTVQFRGSISKEYLHTGFFSG